MFGLQDLFVGYNGQQIVDNSGKTVSETYLDKDLVKKIIKETLVAESSVVTYINGKDDLLAFDNIDDMLSIDYNPASIVFALENNVDIYLKEINDLFGEEVYAYT
jgi:hydroxymethylpyrimidine pyrophosphatase-like HAD family hydrolase